MIKKMFLFVFGLVAITTVAFAQKQVTGKVTDENGSPIVKATITEKGTKNGVPTDENGIFKITVKSTTAVLVIYSVGYERMEISVDKSTIIKLKQSKEDLSEVVVVGYGVQRKKEATGSVVSLKGSSLINIPAQSFDQTLTGKAAGVQITTPNGVLNSPPVFRIRGTNSITLSSYPLIVVDGVPTFTGDYSQTNSAGNALASINPNDIESIDVAKDAAATAIYGSRAANGVVFITTKKGKSGQASVNYNGSYGVTSAFGLPTLLNAQQYIDVKSKSSANNASFTAANIPTFNLIKDTNGNNVDTRWFDYIYRNGISQNHNINIAGGNDATTYYLSFGYTNQQGIIKKNDFIRSNILANIDHKINSYISVGGKISYSIEQNFAATSSGSLSGEAFNTGGLGRIGLVLPPILTPYNKDGTYSLNGAAIGYPNILNTGISYYNPLPLIDKGHSNSEINHIQSNVYIQIKPIKNITLRSVYGIDNLYSDNDLFWTPIAGDGYSTVGNATSSFYKYKRYLWTNTAQYDKVIKLHTFNILIGNEQQRNTILSYGINRQGLSDPSYDIIQAGWVTNNSANQNYGENYLLSNFARVNYNFDNKYFFSGNVRQDEYSALGVKKGTFYGISGGWEIANEGFFINSSIKEVISSLRLKASYGKVGNTAGISDYSPFSTFTSGLYGGLSSLYFNNVGNKNLQWETSTKTDIGLSFGLFKNKISGEFAYYENNIDGLILNVPQAPSTGLTTLTQLNANPPQNVGSMYNKGFEFSLNALVLNSKDFNWNINFNITYNDNKVTSLANGLTDIQSGTSGLETVNRTMPGYSLGNLWVVRTAGIDPQTGKRIFLTKDGTPVYYQFFAPAGQFNWSTTADGTKQYKSASGATAISQANDGVQYKNVIPKYYGGFTNNFKYKSFDLSLTFTYQLDYFIYYGTNAGLHDQRFWNNATDIISDAWWNVGDVNKKYAKPVFGDNVSNGSSMPLDINVFSGDFVKLKTLVFGYTLPKKLLNNGLVKNARVYFSAQNLLIFTAYPGPDPEVSSNGNGIGQGVDRNTAANARTFNFGVNIGF